MGKGCWEEKRRREGDVRMMKIGGGAERKREGERESRKEADREEDGSSLISGP